MELYTENLDTVRLIHSGLTTKQKIALLQNTAKTGCIEVAKYLFSQDTYPESVKEYLCKNAIYNEHVEYFYWLTEHWVDPINIIDRLIKLCVESNMLDILCYLVEYQTDDPQQHFERVNAEGDYYLIIAIENKNLDMVKYLVDKEIIYWKLDRQIIKRANKNIVEYLRSLPKRPEVVRKSTRPPRVEYIY